MRSLSCSIRGEVLVVFYVHMSFRMNQKVPLYMQIGLGYPIEATSFFSWHLAVLPEWTYVNASIVNIRALVVTFLFLFL